MRGIFRRVPTLARETRVDRSAALSSLAARPPAVQALPRLAMLLLAVLCVVFLLDDAMPYLHYSEATYERFWNRSVLLLVHVIGGSIGLLTGLFQLWSGLTRRMRTAHPLTGCVYLAGVTLSSTTAIALALQTEVWTFGVALFVGAFLWLATTSLAVYELILGRIDAHRDWMWRSYILTFSFVSFRLVLELPWVEGLGTEAEIATTFGWLSFVAPLSIYEFARQWRHDSLTASVSRSTSQAASGASTAQPLVQKSARGR